MAKKTSPKPMKKPNNPVVRETVLFRNARIEERAKGQKPLFILTVKKDGKIRDIAFTLMDADLASLDILDDVVVQYRELCDLILEEKKEAK